MVDNSLLALQSADKLERQLQRRTWPFQTNATTTCVQGVAAQRTVFMVDWFCLGESMPNTTGDIRTIVYTP